VAGDFFTDPLPASDAYVLMALSHDWDDAEAVAILRAVAQAGHAHRPLAPASHHRTRRAVPRLHP